MRCDTIRHDVTGKVEFEFNWYSFFDVHFVDCICSKSADVWPSLERECSDWS